MGRDRNLLATRKLTISTTHQVGEYLGDLAKSGLWGKNATEAAERLIADQIRELIRAGELQARRKRK